MHERAKSRDANPFRCLCAVSTVVLLAIAIAGCRRTRATEPREIVGLKVVPTAVGLDVSFAFRDSVGLPTIVLWGAGAIRIEDAPVDSSELARAGDVDSTRVLYVDPIILSRDYFSRETVETANGAEEIDVCELGVFPYRQFRHPPRGRWGILRIAYIPPRGKRVVQASQRFEWPVEAYARQ